MSSSEIKNPVLVYDLDYILYAAGFAGEKRSIEATHKPTGDVFSFSNRTEMYGKGKEIGGWLKETNEARVKSNLSPFNIEDFEIVDIQAAEPLANVLHTVKAMVETPIEALEASKMVGFIGGKGKPLWRWERATLWEYKGNRKDALAPIYKQDIVDYLIKKYNVTIVNDGKEADDRVIMESYQKSSHIVVGVDKDVRGNPVLSYNPNYPEEGILDGRGFGNIYWDDKKKDVKGAGRIFFYWQWLYGDDVDNYRANCASSKKWGKKSAFNVLANCRTDVEAFEVIRDAYKTLYPEEIEVEGWRGDKIKIDWLYVANEIWDMARMWRYENDYVTASEVLSKYKLI